MFSMLISETILMSKLWQELLHSLSAHQAWAHSQRGKTTQVSCFFCFYWERVIAISVSQACLFKLLPALVSRCLADGCSEAFVTNSSMKNHMARVHQQKEKPYQVQKSCFCFYDAIGGFTVTCFCSLFPFSVTIRAAERISTRGTSSKPTHSSTYRFCHFSERLHIWCELLTAWPSQIWVFLSFSM